jgi:hypothetical protein
VATRGSRSTRSSRSSDDGLKESIERLTGAFDRLADRLEVLEARGGGGGVDVPSDPLMRHWRRYGPFWALAVIFAIFLAFLPSRPDGNDNATQASDLTPGGASSLDDGSSASDGAGSGATGGGASGGGAGSGGSAASGASAAGPVLAQTFDWLKWAKTGKTISGFDCKKGVRQIPWSSYAVPCVPKFSGNNGGATSRGVTPKEIIVVERKNKDSANSAAVDAAVQQAGFASEDERQATRAEFIKYFNKVFELWGRKVKHVIYTSEFGDSTQEAQSKGKEGACSDAESILEKYKPFIVIGEGTTAPFGECGAALKMMVEGAGAYYPETWYKKYHPYIWAGVMECERIAYMNAEYIGKRLMGRPAKWAKGLQANKPRALGIYVPNNDQYQHCVNIAERIGREKYGDKVTSRYNYVLDISRFPDEAAKGIVQFNADGVTTVLLACDPLSPIFLTQSARGQNYFPEWITNSAGLTDVEQFARLWDQEEIQWSLFGMSQLGDTGLILSEKGEATRTYRVATGTAIPAGAQTEYFALLRLFAMLQAAGPILTPQNVAAAMWQLPPGGLPSLEVGRTSYRSNPDGSPGRDHTGVDDMREIYWLCTNFSSGDAEGSSRCTAPKGDDGKGGKYVATMGGKRFLPGQWPKGDPPVFPEKP